MLLLPLPLVVRLPDASSSSSSSPSPLLSSSCAEYRACHAVGCLPAAETAANLRADHEGDSAWVAAAEVPGHPPVIKSDDDSSTTVTITNNTTRLDSTGGPLNAHQGSMIRGVGDFSQRFFLYGDYFRACKPLGYGCRCVGDKPGMEVHGIGIYSTADFKTWRNEAGDGSLLKGVNQPRVAFFPSTNLYHMYLQFPLRVATSSRPTGPWQLREGSIQLDTPHSGDINVFVDADQSSYLIYTSGVPPRGDGKIRVQKLSDDGYSAVPNATSDPFPLSKPSEAPLLFKRGNVYFAAFGHNCGCCREGSELFVFMADNPLGPWRGGENVNVDSAGRRVVDGQSAFVVELPSTDASSTFLWATDEWGSGKTRAANLQYWAPLLFDTNGSIRRLKYQTSWQLDLALGRAVHDLKTNKEARLKSDDFISWRQSQMTQYDINSLQPHPQPCNTSQYATSNQCWNGPSVEARPGGKDGTWFFPNVTSFNCSYTVPEVPRHYGSFAGDTHSIFLWCGLQPGGGFGVIQPQIMYGPDCPEGFNDSGVGPWTNHTCDNEEWCDGIHYLGDSKYAAKPYWYWSAQYVSSNDTAKGKWICGTGNLLKATPGQRLETRMWYDHATNSFNSLMLSPDTNESSYFNASCPDYDCSQSWRDLIFSSWNATTQKLEGGKNMVLFIAETYRLDEASALDKLPADATDWVVSASLGVVNTPGGDETLVDLGASWVDRTRDPVVDGVRRVNIDDETGDLHLNLHSHSHNSTATRLKTDDGSTLTIPEGRPGAARKHLTIMMTYDFDPVQLLWINVLMTDGGQVGSIYFCSGTRESLE